MWRTQEQQPGAVQERRQQILRDARPAIAAKGAESVRLLDIARVAGVSIGALQHHFGSRDQLVLDAYRLQADDALAAAAELGADHGDAWDEMVSVIRYLGDGGADDAATWIELCATAVRVPAYREIVAQVNVAWHELVEGIVTRGLDSGRFRTSLQAETLVEVIVTLLDGMELGVASGRTDSDSVTQGVIQAVSLVLGASDVPTTRRTRGSAST